MSSINIPKEKIVSQNHTDKCFCGNPKKKENAKCLMCYDDWDAVEPRTIKWSGRNDEIPPAIQVCDRDTTY